MAARRRFYTPTEVALHNSAEDLWVSIFHKVYDLTPLIAKHRGPLAGPIVSAAGTDISHWFDRATGNVKTHVDPATELEVPYLPYGRFVHVAPAEPVGTWRTDFGTPWWRDAQFCIGELSRRTRPVRIVNVLSDQADVLEVCSEETVEEIRDRYLEFNSHARSYTWKHLRDEAFVPLDMTLTLTENGCPDEQADFERLGIDLDYYVPVIHLYYNDDLTKA